MEFLCGAIEPAEPGDLDDLCGLDPAVQQDLRLRESLRHAIQRGECWISLQTETGIIDGYCLFDYSFFGHGFFRRVAVHPDYRRQGLAYALIDHLQALATTPLVFAAANHADPAARGLLERLGYVISGALEHVTPNGPEIVYVNDLRRPLPGGVIQ